MEAAAASDVSAAPVNPTTALPWGEVWGQPDAVAALQAAASDPASLTHAWLITGPPGSGRSTLARAFAAGLIAEPGNRLAQLTSTTLPEGLDEGPLRKALLANYGIEVGGGLGEFAGRAWRIGLMGHAARERSVVALLGAVDELLG